MIKRALLSVLFCASLVGAFAYGSYSALSDGFAFRLLRDARWSVQGGSRVGSMHAEYAARLNRFALLRSAADVVFLGDSLTAGGEWGERFRTVQVANRGIGRDTTAGILARLDAVIAMKPSMVFVMAGVNDLDGTDVRDEDVLANYRAIISRLQAASVRVVVQSTLHVSKPEIATLANPRIAALNDALATHCARVGCVFADLNKTMAPDGLLLAKYTWDGQHLNGLGYEAWAMLIDRHLTSSR